MFLPVLPLYPLDPELPAPFLLTGGPGSLKDLLLAIPDEAGLCDLGTRDFPMKGFLDLDFGSDISDEVLVPPVCCSLVSFRLPMENLVIFLRVFFSIVDVFSCGEVFPELDDWDLSAVLALELAVAELYSREDTVQSELYGREDTEALLLAPELSLVSLHSLPSLLLLTNFSSLVSSFLRSSFIA